MKHTLVCEMFFKKIASELNLPKLYKFLNMLLRAYNLITKRTTRSLYMMLQKPNKDNKYLIKYCIFGFTFQNPLSILESIIHYGFWKVNPKI